MADVGQYMGEIRLFGGNYAPSGWALCNGQLLAISQNTALFSILGTNFGGDGRVTFGLPNLQDSTPVGMGSGPGLTERDLGEVGGATSVTLTSPELTVHTHNWGGSGNQGDVTTPGPDVVLAQSSPGQAYQTNVTGNLAQFSAEMLSYTGSGFPHNNLMPYIAVTFIIALQGLFPHRG